MDPSTACKLFFIFSTAICIGGALHPSTREAIMNYGSRRSSLIAGKHGDYLLRAISSKQVPHSWFTHYYIVSLVSSAFWGYQIARRGKALDLLASYSHPVEAPMSVNQVILAWLLMTVQGTRRLYESIAVHQKSDTMMWGGIWIAGILFYLFVGVAVWIEGITALYSPQKPSVFPISLYTPQTMLGLSFFLLGSGAQHICHVHLAMLKKYSLPHHWLFQSMICPHYTSECLIYLGLSILSAPNPHLLNKTLLATLGFVVANLAVTADASKKMYISRFGAKDVQNRWKMFPYVY